ncbi:hypothetical protein B0T10DRAFT_569143 [Thelonectria olida]|uniref:Uncharacterized protein n=1 Tax=Thelonectria olida TaxID=1576542 RepID=A0A9P8VPQ9_9HYPO|nr:hypothetical protein B0T10DRAFT_569143 [Thelonectria olida]
MTTAFSHATRVIHASVRQVWGIIASCGGDRLWFPNVTKSSLEGFGVGAVRSLWFGNGPEGKDALDEIPVRERFMSADPATHSLRWQIFNENIGNFETFSSLELRSIDESTTEVVFIEDMYNTAMEAMTKKLEA